MEEAVPTTRAMLVASARTASESELLPFFVYGTLQQGFKNHTYFLKEFLERAEKATVEGFDLYHFTAGFPGIYASSEAGKVVHGEVAYVRAADYAKALEALDALEEYYGPDNKDNMYIRETREVTLADGRKLKCWIYVCLLDIAEEGGVGIHHGNWAKYLLETKQEDAGDDWLLQQRSGSQKK